MRQAQALHIMLSGQSVFLTGAPGAGKTYVLNEFIQRARQQGKALAVTASTGIAATHIGGTTIHSWSGLGIRDRLSQYEQEWLKNNDRLRKRYNSIDILVIDEISMLHGNRLDMVNLACKILRDNPAPFGGLQVILVGDLFQLPPVNRAGELVDFAHVSAAWQELDPQICYITEQHRQSADALLDLLEAMRSGELGDMHIEALQSRHGQLPEAETPVTRLFTHNIDVESINQRHLQALDGESKRFAMQTKGAAAKIEQLVKSVLAPEQLDLKVGAEVMFVANDFAAGFVNGSRGRVIRFDNGSPVVQLVDGREITVEPHSWTLTEDDRKRAEVSQLPLRLAWAITIHKSQGMSLDAAQIDLSKSFTPGMGYVALSRVRSLEGIYLAGINNMALQLHPDIFEFDRRLQRSSAALAEQTPDVAPADPSEEAVMPDDALLDKLKAWRLERARQDHVSPFMIAHNVSLEAIAARPPHTMQQLLGIKGFGPAKQQAYGAELLELVAAHLDDQTSKADLTVNEPLAHQYQAIEAINDQILDLLVTHQQLTDEMAAIKPDRQISNQPEHQQAMLQALRARAQALGLDPTYVETIFSLIYEQNAARQQK